MAYGGWYPVSKGYSSSFAVPNYTKGTVPFFW